jgi:hypothetical protein
MEFIYNGETYYVELKKGQRSFWLPEVRYAELFLSKDKLINHYTVFLSYKTLNKMNVFREIVVIPTIDLLKSLNLSLEWCNQLLERERQMRNINSHVHCQQSFSIKRLTEDAYSIEF